MTIGEQIKNGIRGKGLSLQEAADLLGITRQTLHNQINSAHIKESFIQKVKIKLGISFDSSESNSLVQEGTPVYELSATVV